MKYVRDLFCGDSVGTAGYAAAGFGLWGVDIADHPLNPYQIQIADVFSWLVVWDADVVHASPPCQFLTRAKHLRDAQGGQSKYPDLLTPTLERVRQLSIPWIVENVEGAKALMQPQPGETLIRLCGSSFGLEVQRHRLFLSNMPIVGLQCDHSSFPRDPITSRPRPWGVYHIPNDNIPAGGRTAINAAHALELFGIYDRDYLTWESIKEGFPPVYTFWIGRQLMDMI